MTDEEQKQATLALFDAFKDAAGNIIRDVATHLEDDGRIDILEGSQLAMTGIYNAQTLIGAIISAGKQLGGANLKSIGEALADSDIVIR